MRPLPLSILKRHQCLWQRPSVGIIRFRYYGYDLSPDNCPSTPDGSTGAALARFVYGCKLTQKKRERAHYAAETFTKSEFRSCFGGLPYFFSQALAYTYLLISETNQQRKDILTKPQSPI